METCPVCAHGFELAGPPPTIVSCPACAAPFVPTGATAVNLVARAPDGRFRELGDIELTPGFRARYRLERRVGAGSMGTVYLARIQDGGGAVAVKFLMHEEHPDALPRFLREGRLMLAIRHPNVVAVREVSHLGAHPYLVTEFVPGGTLRERLDRDRRLEPAVAVGLVCDVLSGLAACHERGIVHRDVKPANVLLDGQGGAKIADLGLARAFSGDETAITSTGALLGTPKYMAPEQARGETVGVTADVYSAGIVLYELLCGEPPFDAATVSGLLHAQQVAEPPPLLERAPEVGEELAAVAHRALAKQPQKRYATAHEFARALRDAVGARVRSVTDAGAQPSGAASRADSGPATRMASRTASGAGAKDSEAAAHLTARPWPLLAAFTLVGLLLLGLLRPPGPASPPAPPPSACWAVPAPPAPAEEVAEMRRLVAKMEADPLELIPWLPPAAGPLAQEADCPVLLTCMVHLQRVRIRTGAGCTVVAVNRRGLPRSAGLMGPRGEGFTLLSPAAHRLEEGANWIRLRAEAGHEMRATVFQDRGPCPLELTAGMSPPPEAAAYNRVSSALYGRMPADAAAAREVIAREYPRAGYLRQAAGVRVDVLQDDLVDNIAAVVEQVNDDPVWSDPAKLHAVRGSCDTLQAALRLAPGRWDLWHDLGFLMRKCGQPAAGRTALVRALSVWPGACWSWRELGMMERRSWASSDRRFEHRRDAIRHLAIAERTYLASGLSIFWMIPDLDGARKQLEGRPHRAR